MTPMSRPLSQPLGAEATEIANYPVSPHPHYKIIEANRASFTIAFGELLYGRTFFGALLSTDYAKVSMPEAVVVLQAIAKSPIKT